ncbi:MAG: RIP metalloprotease RseP [Patescibacteria group bacterium]
MLVTIIIFLILLSVLVFVHELGHFLMARRYGVKAEEFGFGFPPRIWGIYRNKEGKWQQVKGKREVIDAPGTIMSINWIPLGGFVKIKGENGENEEENDSFSGRSIWQRFVMLSAGVSMNIILAAILISIGLMFGLPQALDGINPKAEISNEKIQIAQVLPNTPAAAVGLEMADIIISIDNQEFKTEDDIQAYNKSKVGQELTYKIKRGQEELIFQVTPTIIEEIGAGGIGISIVTTGLVKYPWYLAIWEGVKTTIFLTWYIIVAFYDLFKNLIFGQGVSIDIAGPVGIAAFTGQVARMGFIYLIQFTALLSINLAIINFLPIPALDGGRVLFLIIEKIKGSPVKREVEAVIHNIGFTILMLLVLVVTFRDVARFGDVFKGIWEKIVG